MSKAILASVAGLKLCDDEKFVLEQMQPVGVSLFGRNIANKKQLKSLIKSIKEIIGDKAIIAVDQEGGRVRRLAEPIWRGYASQYVLGQLPVSVTKLHAALIAQDLNEVGINFNYAPVLDTAYENTHEVLKSRCFYKAPEKYGQALAETYIKNGICPCMKHMPGHGRATVDPHLGLPIIDGTDDELARDIAPFAANNKLPAGMTAHIVLPQIDSLPITMSKKAVKEIIRKRIGFDGLLITDAIDMHALHGTISEKAKHSLQAGCDVVCYCGGKIDELQELASQDLCLSDEAIERLQKVQDIICGKQIDKQDYEKYSAQIGKIPAYVESYDATETLNRMQKA